MASDIKLHDQRVYVETKLLIANAWDIWLDAPDRKNGGSGPRRALVHNPDDGLTINWANDYPSGVTIEGPTTMNGHVSFSAAATVPDLTIKDLELEALEPSPGRGRPAFEIDPDELRPPIRGPGAAGIGRVAVPSSNDVSLRQYLQQARKEINDLKRRVAELEGDADES